MILLLFALLIPVIFGIRALFGGIWLFCSTPKPPKHYTMEQLHNYYLNKEWEVVPVEPEPLEENESYIYLINRLQQLYTLYSMVELDYKQVETRSKKESAIRKMLSIDRECYTIKQKLNKLYDSLS